MAKKQSKTAGLSRNRTLDPKTFNQMIDRGDQIQKLTRLSRLSSAMEPLESRTLMSGGTLPILPAPFVSTGVAAPATTPTAQVAAPVLQVAKKPAKASAKAPVKTSTAVKTVPLSAPTGLAAKALSRSQVRLSWTDNSKGATGYNVLRSNDGLHFSQIARLSSGAADGFTDSGLTSGHGYEYEVQAVAGSTTSPTSSVATAVTLLAAPSELTARATATSPMHLAWTDNDPSATGYLLLRSTNGSSFTQLTELSGGGTNSFDDTTTTSLTKYYYKIEATNAVGTSPASKVASGTAALTAPAGLAVSVVSPTSATISWTSENLAAKSYSILRSTGGSAFTLVHTITAGSPQSWTDTTLSSDTTYTYEVKAVDGRTTSVPSHTATITTPLKAPTALTAVLGSNGVVLRWTDNDPSATGYSVARSTDGVNFTTLAAVSGARTSSYTDTTAASGRSYTYEVTATSGKVTSAVSNTASVITQLIAPSNVTVDGSTGTAVLTWTDNDSSATGYNISRSSNGTTFVVIAKLSGAAAASYSDATALPSSTYYYQVQAFNAIATSPTSATATVTMPVAAPTGLTAVTSAGAVVLNWTDNDPLATGYNVLRSSDGTTFTQIAQLSSGTATTYIDTSDSTGSEYYYQVQAVNGSMTSASSNTASVATPLAAPTGLSANGATGSVVLTWTDQDSTATGYTILRSTDGTTFTAIAQITGGTVTTYTDSTIGSSNTYYYQVQAFNAVSSSPPSAAAQVTMPVLAPSDLTANASGSSIVLTWTDNDPFATGYRVLRSSDGTTFAQVGQLSSGIASTYTDSAVPTGAQYSYRVLAVNGLLKSAPSNTITVVTLLAAPIGLSVSGSTGSAVLTWTDQDSAATGYNILRSTNGTTFTAIAQATGGTATTYTDSTASPSNTYYYEVQAFNGVSTSAPSAPAQVTMPVAAPTALTTALNGAAVALNWTDNDPLATGYNVLRSSNGTTFTQIAQLSSGSAATYTDPTVSAGLQYYYQVQAVNGSMTSVSSNTAGIVTTLTAPSGLSVSGSTGSAVLTWTDQASAATGYDILRSTNGTTFTAIAQITSGTATTYTDSTVSSSHTYYYEVQAYDAVTTSPASAAASVTMPVLAPSGLTASAGSSSITLAWTDNDPFATGYVVLRSTNGTTFTTLTTLSQATANSYVDSSVTAGQQYYYQVQAVSGSLTSAASNTATATVPSSAPSTVTIATRYTNELVITLTGTADTVSVSQSGSILTIVADGQSSTQSVPAGGLFIYTGTGNDSVQVGSSVSVQTTIETINTGVDTISSTGSDVTVWDDSSDILTGTAAVHTVSAFAGGVSLAAGASLPNPSDSGSVMTVSAPLWGTGPVPADVNQGDSGDCYLLASLAAFASVNPTRLEQSAVDMGDGTYTVEFYSNGSPEFVRVSDQLPTDGGGSYVYAHPGASGSIWAPIIEKAYAYFRTGANTYASIGTGWMGDVYTALDIPNTFLYSSSDTTDSALYTQLGADLSAGEAVTMGTFSSSPNLVSSHAYTLMSVTVVGGVGEYVVRNPWGFSGDSLENSQGYATLDYAQFEANFQDVCAAT